MKNVSVMEIKILTGLRCNDAEHYRKSNYMFKMHLTNSSEKQDWREEWIDRFAFPNCLDNQLERPYMYGM